MSGGGAPFADLGRGNHMRCPTCGGWIDLAALGAVWIMPVRFRPPQSTSRNNPRDGPPGTQRAACRFFRKEEAV